MKKNSSKKLYRWNIYKNEVYVLLLELKISFVLTKIGLEFGIKI